MTNGDIFKLFKERFPELEVDDYRPLDHAFAEERSGITIWLKNGDMLLYFPNTEEVKQMTDEEALHWLNALPDVLPSKMHKDAVAACKQGVQALKERILSGRCSKTK